MTLDKDTEKTHVHKVVELLENAGFYVDNAHFETYGELGESKNPSFPTGAIRLRLFPIGVITFDEEALRYTIRC